MEVSVAGWRGSLIVFEVLLRVEDSALVGDDDELDAVARASVVGVELHMHLDVGVCSIGSDELIAVLLLRHQRGHAVQPAPRLWNGREREVSRTAA